MKKAWIPNGITTIGIIAGTVAFFSILFSLSKQLALVSLSITALSDVIDGFYARKLQQSSSQGAILDWGRDLAVSVIFAVFLNREGQWDFLLLFAFIEILGIIASVNFIYNSCWGFHFFWKLKQSLLFVCLFVHWLFHPISNVIFTLFSFLYIVVYFLLVDQTLREASEKKEKNHEK